MTNKRYFIRLISMLDFQLYATELGMHNPIAEQGAVSGSDAAWVQEHDTYLFPIMEKAPICLRFIAQRIAQVKQIPHHDIWLVWSRAPKLWPDASAKIAYGDPVDEHQLLREWGNFTLRKRSLMRTTEQVLEVWPAWLQDPEREWFTGKPDPTCLT